MAYDTDTRRRVVALCLSEGVSTRTVARSEGIPHSTVATWVKEEKASQVTASEELGDEVAVARAMMKEARAMLTGLSTRDSKAQADVAGAIDKLVKGYLALAAGGDTNINVHNENSAENDEVAQMLKQFLK